MEIIKEYEPGDDFVVLRVVCPPLKEKRVSVSVEALASGAVTLEDEIAREASEAEERLRRHQIVQELIK